MVILKKYSFVAVFILANLLQVTVVTGGPEDQQRAMDLLQVIIATDSKEAMGKVIADANLDEKYKKMVLMGLLLESKADDKKKCMGADALIKAGCAVNFGIDIKLDGTKYKKLTPLHFAVIEEKFELVKILVPHISFREMDSMKFEIADEEINYTGREFSCFNIHTSDEIEEYLKQERENKFEAYIAAVNKKEAQEAQNIKEKQELLAREQQREARRRATQIRFNKNFAQQISTFNKNNADRKANAKRSRVRKALIDTEKTTKFFETVLDLFERKELLLLKQYLQNHTDFSSINFDYQNERGEAVLIAAALCASPELVSFFLSHGANPNLETIERISALDAVLLGEGDESAKCIIINMLLRAGADVNHVGKQGASVLHLALVGENPALSIIELLLNAGAKVATRDEYGRVPIDYLTRSNAITEQIKELLSPSLENKTRRTLGRLGHQARSIFTTRQKNLLAVQPPRNFLGNFNKRIVR